MTPRRSSSASSATQGSERRRQSGGVAGCSCGAALPMGEVAVTPFCPRLASPTRKFPLDDAARIAYDTARTSPDDLDRQRAPHFGRRTWFVRSAQRANPAGLRAARRLSALRGHAALRLGVRRRRTDRLQPAGAVVALRSPLPGGAHVEQPDQRSAELLPANVPALVPAELQRLRAESHVVAPEHSGAAPAEHGAAVLPRAATAARRLFRNHRGPHLWRAPDPHRKRGVDFRRYRSAAGDVLLRRLALLLEFSRRTALGLVAGVPGAVFLRHGQQGDRHRAAAGVAGIRVDGWREGTTPAAQCGGHGGVRRCGRLVSWPALSRVEHVRQPRRGTAVAVVPAHLAAAAVVLRPQTLLARLAQPVLRHALRHPVRRATVSATGAGIAGGGRRGVDAVAAAEKL